MHTFEIRNFPKQNIPPTKNSPIRVWLLSPRKTKPLFGQNPCVCVSILRSTFHLKGIQASMVQRAFILVCLKKRWRACLYFNCVLLKGEEVYHILPIFASLLPIFPHSTKFCLGFLSVATFYYILPPFYYILTNSTKFYLIVTQCCRILPRFALFLLNVLTLYYVLPCFYYMLPHSTHFWVLIFEVLPHRTKFYFIFAECYHSPPSFTPLSKC